MIATAGQQLHSVDVMGARPVQVDLTPTRITILPGETVVAQVASAHDNQGIFTSTVAWEEMR